MQYCSLYIKNLFGLYTYFIDFNASDGISIITGPNGYGKTTILTILGSLSPDKLYYFYELKFEQIVVKLSDRSTIKISSSQKVENVPTENSDRRQSQSKTLRIVWVDAEEKEISFFEYNPTNISKASREWRYKMYSINHRVVRNEYNKELVYTREFNEIVAHSIGQDQFLMQLEGIQTTFIRSNRIYNEANEDNELTPVEKIQKKMMLLLQEARSNYLLQSQRIDNEFIHQIISTSNVDSFNKEEYLLLEDEARKQMQCLSKYQLTDKIVLPEYKKENGSALYAYLRGLKAKYSSYGTLLHKLDTFAHLLSNKKFSSKQVEFSPMHGFRVISTDGDDIDVRKLSSGEQNEIILLYSLIFELSDGTILLVDEPENSLHVAWQNGFIEDLELITKMKKTQAILATHSISIASQGEKYITDLYYLHYHD